MIVRVSKGQQITIPADYRKDLNLREGSNLEMIRRGDRMIIQPIGEDLEQLFREALTIKPKRKLTAEQMDELIENEVLRQ